MSSSSSSAQPSSAQTVRTEQRGPVWVVTIDRPAHRNAVDRSTAEQLVEAFETFERRDDLHVAVLTGAGDTFCAGADLKAFAAGRGNRLEPEGAGPMGPTRMVLNKPVIAAVEGFAVAGGLELAIWCDLRVAARTATFGVFCRRFGVPLIDGGTVRLPRLIGQSRAMEMILTGRPVEAEEAHRWGLVNRLVEPGKALNEAVRRAEQIAGFPQTCLRSDRRSALEQWGLDEARAIAREFELGQPAIRSEAERGAARFADGEGRRGSFEG